MKYAKFSIVLCLILVIITVLPVFGQGDYPPQLSEPLEPNVSPFASVPEIEKETLGQSSEPETRTVIPQPRNLVEIATAGNNRYSAADHGGGYVAVAHNNDWDIYVFLYYYGVFINRFQVSDGNGDSWAPDIAYEASSGLFIVTWTTDTETTEGWNIQAVAVDPNIWGDHIVGDIVDVASSSWAESYPSVDCNYFDQSCLVAYNLDNRTDFFRIDGRYMHLDPTNGIETGSSSPNFAISTLENEHNPHVAWSEPDENYMVAYTWPATGGGEMYPVHSVVMEDWHPVYSQIVQGTSYSIATEWLEHTNKYVTGIAYDNCSENYVIVFTHDYYDNGTDYDVFVTVIDSENYLLHGLTTIAASSASEHSADISYLKDADAAEGDPAPDKLVLAYVRDGDEDPNGIVATDLRGNCNPINPSYEIDFYLNHYVVISANGFDYQTRYPAITGSNNWWEFFVAFSDDTSGQGFGIDYDIFGRYMDAADKTYLPLLNH